MWREIKKKIKMNGVLCLDSVLVRLCWAGDNCGEYVCADLYSIHSISRTPW